MHARIRETRESYGTNGENLGRGGVAADAEDLQLQWEHWCINGAWWRLRRFTRSHRQVSKTAYIWQETDNSCKTSLFNLQPDSVRCFSILTMTFLLLALLKTMICSYGCDCVSEWCACDLWPIALVWVFLQPMTDKPTVPHRWELSEEVSMTSTHSYNKQHDRDQQGTTP